MGFEPDTFRLHGHDDSAGNADAPNGHFPEAKARVKAALTAFGAARP
jgi:hypothetical protein